jgi:hypothetical protein
MAVPVYSFQKRFNGVRTRRSADGSTLLYDEALQRRHGPV